MIGIINYAAGNGPSVAAALRHLGVECALISSPAEVRSSSKIVLPGVGSAGATMASLRELDLIGSLTEAVNERAVPFLGICVGLQVLFSYSEEDSTDCLGWLPGKVERFDSSAVRVPQMGWNRLDKIQDHSILNGVTASSYCYFVNSYQAIVSDPAVLIATTEYNGRSTAIVSKANIVATQFHIEKSGQVGLKMLGNFARGDA